ncbi:hypothetical protein [Paeniglutamicibacter psychrophenolicus]|uniref:hypothetical protein n=1 Tax=Paeniglutamicibacter psychrophenolicus TaxID=257454 RepID=UPI00278B42E8|nr:hypothetical protein [Paeniglutamicibacter psychrophenolicus]MDQ0094331.1 hypothetical protein [Paeniglutamicibacter psychrophenolicus]
MIATGVDPRCVSEEDPQPVHRVDFRDENGAGDEWRLVAADDVHEALRWAQVHAAGRTASICAEFTYVGRGERTVALIRLAGPDPA